MSKYLKISLVFILVLLTGCGTVTKGNNIVKTKTESTEQQWANEVTATIDAAGNVTVISENSQTDSATDAGANTDAGNKDNSPNNKPADNDNQMINVSISIDCKTILNNMNDLKDGYEQFIPTNGMILSTEQFKVKKNTTVIDVLKKATSENEIKLVTVSSGFGLYVKGIGQIEEKICGSSSGWMYKVNGNFPEYGASSYRLKDGDKIEWRFTCKQGDV